MILLLLLLLTDVRPLSLAEVCGTRWSEDTRHVTLAMRHAVFRRDKVLWSEHTRVVLDHRVPRQLAGADVVENLQVQTPHEAKLKDLDERRLWRAVCQGEMLLKDAQQQMREWKPPE